MTEPQVLTADPPEPDIVIDECEELIPQSRVSEIMVRVKAKERRRYERQLAELEAAHEHELELCRHETRVATIEGLRMLGYKIRTDGT